MLHTPTESIVLSLLRRNLFEVFGEHDDARRLATIAEIFTERAELIDHRGVSAGWSEIDRAARSLQKQYPRHVFRERQAQAIAGAGRIEWAFGPGSDAAVVMGVDFALFEGNRIRAMYTFVG